MRSVERRLNTVYTTVKTLGCGACAGTPLTVPLGLGLLGPGPAVEFQFGMLDSKAG